ncbi:MAG: acyl-CoA dehydrogenase protein, partial [Bacteroidetes bacterium]|nr:acyl-CoA dehydrogenase protein [Bacteroidota bacterium]
MEATTKTARYPKEKNRVLTTEFKPSTNFYQSDAILRHYLATQVSKEGLSYMEQHLHYTGTEAAGPMNELSLLADHQGPELVKRNFFGENINEIKFHPSYWELMKTAVKSHMFRVKWEPSLRAKFGHEGHRLGFSTGYLYAMSEAG